jgi:NAD-dependent deacetylase
MMIFTDQLQAAIDFAADLFRTAKHVAALTGAGLSTPSGIPDFRSKGTGLWSRDEPLKAAALNAFCTAPKHFFEWFRPLVDQIHDAKPNRAPMALAELETHGHLHAIVTKNIDALHQKAGSQHAVEMHGTLQTLTCVQCYQQVHSRDHMQAFLEQGEIPRCSKCDAVLKPDVILLEEHLPQGAWLEAPREVRLGDLMLVAGSSLEVPPVAGLPMQALDQGAHLIILNNTPTYLNARADVAILEDVARTIPAIVERTLYG